MEPQERIPNAKTEPEFMCGKCGNLYAVSLERCNRCGHACSEDTCQIVYLGDARAH